MSQAETAEAQDVPTTPKRRILPLLAGLVAALVLGGASFYSVHTGWILAPTDPAWRARHQNMDFAFIPLENMTISLVSPGGARLLRFSGQIEVAAESHAQMTRLEPRFRDVVNSYLHAIDPADLETPAALIRLRSQILRRLQVVAGDGHVRDFLITEFILNHRT